jgi:prolyl oligopeptidase
LGTSFAEDQEIFSAGRGENLRLCLISDATRLGFLVYKFAEETRTSFYVGPFEGRKVTKAVTDVNCVLNPLLASSKIFAATNREAPNFRIVELRLRQNHEAEWIGILPETHERLHHWLVVGNKIFASYNSNQTTHISVFDFSGHKTLELPANEGKTLHLAGASHESDEVFLESESFTEPVQIERCSSETGQRILWEQRKIPFDSAKYACQQHCYATSDGTQVPVFLVGRPDVLQNGPHPAIMTSYGGFGVSATPQFSVLVAFLLERGCLFALPGIRGGSEFGTAWHDSAKRRHRQTAYDDFLSAAEWLVETRRTSANRLAIFGGSNSGLLVGAAMTQQPELFCAVLCMVPLLDMLRYHLFDDAHIWRDEFGTVDDATDFAALRAYSPYHHVRNGTAYPATLIVSGDSDGNCNPLHARKMVARLQAANNSDHPILLDYKVFRGHSPVLPSSVRIEALTDRLAFLCDRLELAV